MRLTLATAALALALTGCASSQPKVATSVYASASLYDATLKAAHAYEASGVADPNVVAEIKKLDAAAYPVVQKVEANHNNVSADEALALSAAVEPLSSYLIQNGVK